MKNVRRLLDVDGESVFVVADKVAWVRKAKPHPEARVVPPYPASFVGVEGERLLVVGTPSQVLAQLAGSQQAPKATPTPAPLDETTAAQVDAMLGNGPAPDGGSPE